MRNRDYCIKVYNLYYISLRYIENEYRTYY